MGPLLFSLCVNDLPNQLSEGTDKGLYADDFQFMIHGSIDDMFDMINRANSELCKISDWFEKKKLRLNASKSNALFVSCNRMQLSDDLPDIVLNGQKISIVENAKNLGLYIDDALKFDRHINEMVKKIYFSLHSLKMNKLYLSSDLKLMLVKSLVIPHFLYCDVILNCVNASLKSKIEKAFKSVIRFCFDLRKRESTKQYEDKIFGCGLWKYFNYRFSIFIFKIIFYKEPQYLFEKLQFSRSERTCNLVTPKFTNRQRNRFCVRASQLWNSLPNELKREKNFDVFCKLSFAYHSNS